MLVTTCMVIRQTSPVHGEEFPLRTLFNMNKLIVLMFPLHELKGHKLMSLHITWPLLRRFGERWNLSNNVSKTCHKVLDSYFRWTFLPILNNSIFCAIFLMVHAQQIRHSYYMESRSSGHVVQDEYGTARWQTSRRMWTLASSLSLGFQLILECSAPSCIKRHITHIKPQC